MEITTQKPGGPTNAETSAPARQEGHTKAAIKGSALVATRGSLAAPEFKLLTHLCAAFEIDMTISFYGVSAAILVTKDALQNQN